MTTNYGERPGVERVQHTPGEARARQMVQFDSGTAVDTRDEFRAHLRMVLDLLDDEREKASALLAALEALEREAGGELATLDAGCAVGRYGLRNALESARAAIAQARGEVRP